MSELDDLKPGTYDVKVVRPAGDDECKLVHVDTVAQRVTRYINPSYSQVLTAIEMGYDVAMERQTRAQQSSAEPVTDDNSPSELDINPDTHPSYTIYQSAPAVQPVGDLISEVKLEPFSDHLNDHEYVLAYVADKTALINEQNDLIGELQDRLKQYECQHPEDCNNRTSSCCQFKAGQAAAIPEGMVLLNKAKLFDELIHKTNLSSYGIECVIAAAKERV